jgi:L-alanine-DL-glutamate epimerase-like enolase superfamily enzyme
MQVRDIAGNCLIKVDTDAGLVGYGEAGASGPMARSRIEQIKRLLVGQDPLSIERHFLNMITLMHPYMAHIPTVSGIDIALWDLAGKITGQPVNVLLRPKTVARVIRPGIPRSGIMRYHIPRDRATRDARV